MTSLLDYLFCCFSASEVFHYECVSRGVYYILCKSQDIYLYHQNIYFVRSVESIFLKDTVSINACYSLCTGPQNQRRDNQRKWAALAADICGVCGCLCNVHRPLHSLIVASGGVASGWSRTQCHWARVGEGAVQRWGWVKGGGEQVFSNWGAGWVAKGKLLRKAKGRWTCNSKRMFA